VRAVRVEQGAPETEGGAGGRGELAARGSLSHEHGAGAGAGSNEVDTARLAACTASYADRDAVRRRVRLLRERDCTRRWPKIRRRSAELWFHAGTGDRRVHAVQMEGCGDGGKDTCDVSFPSALPAGCRSPQGTVVPRSARRNAAPARPVRCASACSGCRDLSSTPRVDHARKRKEEGKAERKMTRKRERKGGREEALSRAASACMRMRAQSLPGRLHAPNGSTAVDRSIDGLIESGTSMQAARLRADVGVLGRR